jgi:hypothetical protein
VRSLVRSFLSAALGCALASQARADVNVASALDKDNPLDIFVSVDYSFSMKRADLRREGPGTSDAPLPSQADLVYAQDRHLVTPRLEIGLYHDLELNVALPIVLSDTRHYDLAGGVTAASSSTIRDGILPASGYDAGNPSGSTSGSRIFDGVTRKGLDQLHLGLAWAALSQKRDDTKPTWILGGEVRNALGDPMRFDRNDPGAEDSVGRGFNEFRLYTTIGKQLSWARMWSQVYWQAPLNSPGADGAETKPDTQFFDVGFGQDAIKPQQHAGVSFDLELVPYLEPTAHKAFAIQFGGSLDANFQGRGYSEMWEVFAYGGDVRNDPAAPLAIDPDPTATSGFISHPGVTTIENSMAMSGRIAVRGELGPYVKVFAGFELAWEQAHHVSFDDAGNDRGPCSGAVTSSCESPDDNFVTPGTTEVNPLFVPLIDQPGRRYIVDGAMTYTISAGVQLLF